MGLWSFITGGNSSSEDGNESSSNLQTALEDEYLYKYHVLISEDLDEEEYSRVAERVNELRHELRKHR